MTHGGCGCKDRPELLKQRSTKNGCGCSTPSRISSRTLLGMAGGLERVLPMHRIAEELRRRGLTPLHKRLPRLPGAHTAQGAFDGPNPTRPGSAHSFFQGAEGELPALFDPVRGFVSAAIGRAQSVVKPKFQMAPRRENRAGHSRNLEAPPGSGISCSRADSPAVMPGNISPACEQVLRAVELAARHMRIVSPPQAPMALDQSHRLPTPIAPREAILAAKDARSEQRKEAREEARQDSKAPKSARDATCEERVGPARASICLAPGYALPKSDHAGKPFSQPPQAGGGGGGGGGEDEEDDEPEYLFIAAMPYVPDCECVCICLSFGWIAALINLAAGVVESFQEFFSGLSTVHAALDFDHRGPARTAQAARIAFGDVPTHIYPAELVSLVLREQTAQAALMEQRNGNRATYPPAAIPVTDSFEFPGGDAWSGTPPQLRSEADPVPVEQPVFVYSDVHEPSHGSVLEGRLTPAGFVVDPSNS